MARSDRSRRPLFVVAVFVSAFGVAAVGACSAVPDVVYVSTDAATPDVRTDGPNPADTGVKDTGQDTGTVCGTPICCGTKPCVDCTVLNDCATCGNCTGGDVCCRKGGSDPMCRNQNQCKL